MKIASMNLTGVALAGLACLLTSCATFAPPERGAEDGRPPDAFTLYESTAPSPERWWESFDCEELNRFVEAGLDGNLSLQQVYARLRQAEMVARQTGALRWPEADYSGGASTTRSRTDTGGLSTAAKLNAASTRVQQAEQLMQGVAALPSAPLAGLTQAGGALDGLATDTTSATDTSTTESYNLGLTGSWEIDLWGRVRAERQAAMLDVETSKEDLYAAMLSLSGTVVLQWLDVVAARQALALIEEQRALNDTYLELIELRYRKGMATALDVYQQRQIVAQTEALVPSTEASLETARHELAVLLGQAPRAGLGVEAASLPAIGSLPEPGVPADLLARRPDVRSAGLQLRAADWLVSAARADRLPSVTLTASASYESGEWELLFDNWMATLAGSLTGPIFDAGKRKAEVARTRAVVDEYLAAYRESVLGAVQEVEDAMFQEVKQGEYIAALKRQLEAVRKTHEQALQRYQKGMDDYLPVLQALSDLQVLERTLVQAQLDHLIYRVQLCLALGGTWMKEELLAPEE